ncbi:Sulfate transport system permease protein CysW [Oligella ureolytica]|uniref:Sulfate transport system permease protein CysW n=1 Tax=Oligella ureolytica TaxID=90244 RepID=A0A378XEF1_9BURK|nr:sulfate ABC transporter permease subunit CysW [Oligella ureolytica]QPT41046.1 sulfate ABC transporter permease subunit CysW [Oligella ureolytica]SUA53543.1 Sulfate transport system permease protein CysW [Oligella ureolytica]SUA53656.1 Sulfate transport system permease protein CysW [Oligella ureolytica]
MKRTNQNSVDEPRWLKFLLIAIATAFLGVMLVIPLFSIFVEAFRQGWGLYIASLTEPDAVSAIKLTLLTAAIVLPINVIFGIAVAWLLTRFDFRGKQWMTTLLDLPFSVSPVVAGLMFILLFGSYSFLGSWLESIGVQVIFAVPGIVIATLFVTFPFIARELIPLMQSQGSSEEQAALVLGASSWQMFWRVTLPNIRWALLYGIILSNARAMGEFGAVSVVSGHIRGLTNTLPLHIDVLYNDYNPVGAFAAASLLAFLAILTLLLQHALSWWEKRKYKQALASHAGKKDFLKTMDKKQDKVAA